MTLHIRTCRELSSSRLVLFDSFSFESASSESSMTLIASLKIKQYTISILNNASFRSLINSSQFHSSKNFNNLS